MPKSKVKRTKKHRPIAVKTNAVEWAIGGAFTFPIETQQKIMKEPLAAFELLRQGKASRDDWNMICQALNVGEALCELNICNNRLDDFNKGHDALHQIALRMLAGKPSTCYAHELAAVKEAMDMHKIQLQFCSQGEFSRAVKRVTNLLKGGAQDDVAMTYARLNGAVI
ncbi:hypothetical protein [Undibacterium sp.]|uniref:hypothetical protein n=1 Tax=Undibacterium sp. TaxID=1914977 RepID=UPI0037518B66